MGQVKGKRRDWKPLLFLRYGLVAPFSRRYSARFSARLDSERWIAQGFYYRHICRDSYLVPHTGAIYVAVPKAACTTLKYLLASDGYRSKPGRVHYYDESGLTHLLDAGYTPEALARRLVPAFTVVRNPIDRFLSAYANKFSSKADSRLSLTVRQALGRESEDEVSVDELIDYVEQTPPHLANQHLAAQWALTAAERIPYAFIIKTENLSADLIEAARLGLVPESFAQSPLLTLNRGKSEKPTLSAHQRARLVKVFARDFELFGYEA